MAGAPARNRRRPSQCQGRALRTNHAGRCLARPPVGQLPRRSMIPRNSLCILHLFPARGAGFDSVGALRGSSNGRLQEVDGGESAGWGGGGRLRDGTADQLDLRQHPQRPARPDGTAGRPGQPGSGRPAGTARCGRRPRPGRCDWRGRRPRRTWSCRSGWPDRSAGSRRRAWSFRGARSRRPSRSGRGAWSRRSGRGAWTCRATGSRRPARPARCAGSRRSARRAGTCRSAGTEGRSRKGCRLMRGAGPSRRPRSAPRACP